LWCTAVPIPADMDSYLDTAVAERGGGVCLPFAVIDKQTDTWVGCTRYMDVEAGQKRLEIWSTWYAKRVQRTGLNTECKYLLLQHAFETLGCIAVEFRTHFHNRPSREAILRLGAKQDGILRNHRVDERGNLRDTVVFSIIDSEWRPDRTGLEFRMGRGVAL